MAERDVFVVMSMPTGLQTALGEERLWMIVVMIQV